MFTEISVRIRPYGVSAVYTNDSIHSESFFILFNPDAFLPFGVRSYSESLRNVIDLLFSFFIVIYRVIYALYFFLKQN